MTPLPRPPVIAYSIILNGLHHLRHNDYANFVLQHFDYWIVVEGAARSAGSTNWCRPMPGSFHRRGRSVDGTLQFLQKLGRRHHNLRLVVNRGMWSSKDAMVNAAVDELRTLTSRCILFHIDIDEQWTAEGIECAVAEMIGSGAKTGCSRANRYYVGKDLIAVTPEAGLLRVSNWSGERYRTHEPSIWEGGNQPTIILSPHVEHYSYYFERDVRFKDQWYGHHRGIYRRWLRLQREKHFPHALRYLFPWKPAHDIVIKKDDRRLRRAEAQLAKEPHRPRRYWMVARALKDLARNDEAVALFRQVLRRSRSGPEIYLSRLGLAECYWRQGRQHVAVREARSALRAFPDFPEAYFLLGCWYADHQQFQSAVEMYARGLAKGKPRHGVRAYAPHFYDSAPKTQLAEAYLRLLRPDLAFPLFEQCLKASPQDRDLQRDVRLTRRLRQALAGTLSHVRTIEQIKSKRALNQALERIPDQLKAHPAICVLRNTRFIKRRSSGRDLVIVCGGGSQHWTPQTLLDRDSSTGEDSVVELARHLAELGWRVTVYTDSGMNSKSGDVHYKSSCLWNYRDRQDVVILWQLPECLDLDIRCERITVDLHDPWSQHYFTPERVRKVGTVFLKSGFHRELYPMVPDEKCEVIPNGIDSALFRQPVDRDPYLIVNTSHPGKSLAALTEIFANVKRRIPRARLQWAYGWERCDISDAGRSGAMRWKRALRRRMKMVGVEELGRISHREVARMYLRANVWAHPTTFAETGCVSFTNALAAGAIPVTSDFGEPGEGKVSGGVFVPTDVTAETWPFPLRHDYSITNPQEIRHTTESLLALLEQPPREEARDEQRQWAQHTYDWRKIAARWDAALRR